MNLTYTSSQADAYACAYSSSWDFTNDLRSSLRIPTGVEFTLERALGILVGVRSRISFGESTIPFAVTIEGVVYKTTFHYYAADDYLWTENDTDIDNGIDIVELTSTVSALEVLAARNHLLRSAMRSSGVALKDVYVLRRAYLQLLDDWEF